MIQDWDPGQGRLAVVVMEGHGQPSAAGADRRRAGWRPGMSGPAGTGCLAPQTLGGGCGSDPGEGVVGSCLRQFGSANREEIKHQPSSVNKVKPDADVSQPTADHS